MPPLTGLKDSLGPVNYKYVVPDGASRHPFFPLNVMSKNPPSSRNRNYGAASRFTCVHTALPCGHMLAHRARILAEKEKRR